MCLGEAKASGCNFRHKARQDEKEKPPPSFSHSEPRGKCCSRNKRNNKRPSTCLSRPKKLIAHLVWNDFPSDQIVVHKIFNSISRRTRSHRHTLRIWNFILLSKLFLFNESRWAARGRIQTGPTGPSVSTGTTNWTDWLGSPPPARP